MKTFTKNPTKIKIKKINKSSLKQSKIIMAYKWYYNNTVKNKIFLNVTKKKKINKIINK